MRWECRYTLFGNMMIVRKMHDPHVHLLNRKAFVWNLGHSVHYVGCLVTAYAKVMKNSPSKITVRTRPMGHFVGMSYICSYNEICSM